MVRVGKQTKYETNGKVFGNEKKAYVNNSKYAQKAGIMRNGKTRGSQAKNTKERKVTFKI